jgi:hypothetical protein
MALGKDTFNDIGGAVSDLFAGFGATQKADLTAQGLTLTAQGTLITAKGTRLNAEALRTKAKGDIAEGENYDLASGLARANEAFTAQSTRIQSSQTDRQITQTIGGQKAGVAAAGFASGGSAGDLLRDSASQGALAKGVLAQQGVITEAGYEEQAKSFDTMSATARMTAASEFDTANKTDEIAGQQDQIAAGQQNLAAATRKAGEDQATGDFISSAIKGVAAVATLFI